MAVLGSGMAGQAEDKMRLRKLYNEQAIAATIAGEEVKPFDDWLVDKLADEASGGRKVADTDNDGTEPDMDEDD